MIAQEPKISAYPLAKFCHELVIATKGEKRFFDPGVDDDQIENLIDANAMLAVMVNAVDGLGQVCLAYCIYCYHDAELCIRTVSATRIGQVSDSLLRILQSVIGEGRPYSHVTVRADDLTTLGLFRSLGLKATHITELSGVEHYFMTNNPDEVFRDHS